MHHLKNILITFAWIRRKMKYLLEIRECRRQQRQTKRSARINVGDIVVIHEDEKHFGNYSRIYVMTRQ
jgi:hypothetical protein